eukprot:scaffold4805_cov136-Cylindrotheca_fusiformis.AAC.29
MMNKIDQEAVLNNNNGVHHLRQGNCAEAIPMLLTCLQQTREQLHHSPECQSPSQTKDGSSLKIDFVPLDRAEDSMQWSGSDSRQDDLFIVKSAMTITVNEECAVPSSELLPLIAVSAIYNLALAHHLVGHYNNSQHHLQKALHYYEISYKMQRSEEVCHNSTLVLCVLNNVAMIYRSMGNEEKSQAFLQQMHQLVSFLMESGYQQQQLHWNGLWGNILGLLVGPPSAAGAA